MLSYFSTHFFFFLFWPVTLRPSHVELYYRVIWVKVLLLNGILIAPLPATWLLDPFFPTCCPGASVSAQAQSAMCGVSCLLAPLPALANAAPAPGTLAPETSGPGRQRSWGGCLHTGPALGP